jgi:hypothetical protein
MSGSSACEGGSWPGISVAAGRPGAGSCAGVLPHQTVWVRGACFTRSIVSCGLGFAMRACDIPGPNFPPCSPRVKAGGLSESRAALRCIGAAARGAAAP